MSLLFAVRDFLREQGAATISQVVGSLQLPRATIEDALLHWQRRGQVEVVEPEMAGGGCSSGQNAGGCSSGGGCSGGGCKTTLAQPVLIYRWRA